MNQREAVFGAVCAVLHNAGIAFEPKVTIAKELMTTELRKQVNEILCQGFLAGTIDLKDTPANKAKLNDPKELMSYVSGLQSNWLAKDLALNGNIAHEIKDKGSRAGTTDPQIKALKALRATMTDADNIAEIDSYIAARLAETVVKKVEVNFDDLPEELKAKYAKA